MSHRQHFLTLAIMLIRICPRKQLLLGLGVLLLFWGVSRGACSEFGAMMTAASVVAHFYGTRHTWRASS